MEATGALNRLGALPFLLAFAVLLLVHTAEGISQAILSPYLQTAGYSLADIGLLVGLAPAISLVSRLPVALVYRGARARWLLAGAAATLAASYLLYLLPAAVPLARLLHGASFGAATTVNFAHFLGLAAAAPALRTRAIAYFTALMAGGFSGGALLGGVAADWWDYPAALALGAGCNLVAGGLALGFARPPALAPGGAHRDADRAAWQRLLSRPALEAALLACVLNALSYLHGTLLPLYALGVGLSLAAVGSIRAAHALANAVTRPLLAGPVGRLGPRRLGLLGLGGVALCVALTPSFTSFTALALLALPMGLARAAAFLVASIAAAESTERHGVPRGMASGLLNVGLDLGAVLGPAVGGAVAAALGIEPALRLLPPALFVGYLLLASAPPGWRAAPQ